MDDLADRAAGRGVTSAFVYTREAHPGECISHHTSMEVKRGNARAFAEHSAVRRPIFLDDVDGTLHIAYGLLPNMTWIVGRGGQILYKAAWNDGVASRSCRCTPSASPGESRIRQGSGPVWSRPEPRR